MGYTLRNFYKSREWERLLDVIKAERLTEEGELICAHCDKPIVRKYDCIGHHTVKLTEQNVNDAAVSLNPDLIALVHHKCHNRIHNKLGSPERYVYLVYGSPLSGKTTWVKSVMEPGDLLVDMENIWECVSGCARYVKPDRLKENVFAIRNLLLEQVKTRTGKWNNAYVIGGYPLIGERERLTNTLGAREIFIDCGKEECLARLEKDSGGRDKAMWRKYIEEWWRMYSAGTPPTLAEDRAPGDCYGGGSFRRNGKNEISSFENSENLKTG